MSTSPSPTVREEKGAVRKFLFDRSFDDPTAPKPKTKTEQAPPPKPQLVTVEQLEFEKTAAYDDGFKAGQKKVENSQQAQQNALLTKIDNQLSSLVASNDQFQQQLIQHAREVAVAIARKILPAYMKANGLQEIESIINQVLAERSHEPRLVVRVSDAHFDELSEKINTLAQQKAYAGKVIVLAEEGLGPADCRVEWADGGIERDTAALWQSIENIMGTRTNASEIGNDISDTSPLSPESRTPIPGDST